MYKADILVVDDSLEHLRMLSNLLTENGYQARPVRSGERAIITALKERPDLILLDVRMPNLDGYETCQQIKSQPQLESVPIIFISALDEVLDKVKAFTIGGVDYITKPFHEAEVLARMETQLTVRALQRQLQAQNDALEATVEARTAELLETNQQLRHEIKQRQQQEQDKERLLNIVRQQSDQLQLLLQNTLANQGQKRYSLAQTLHNQIEQALDHIHTRCHSVTQLLAEESLQNEKQLIQQHMQKTHGLIEETQHQLDIVMAELEQSTKMMITDPFLQLTGRDREIVQLLADGKTTEEIADLLHLSSGTISTYRTRIMKKLQLSSFADLVKLAIKHELTSLD